MKRLLIKSEGQTPSTRWLTKQDYNFIYSRVPRLCVDLVVKDKRGLLLTFRRIEPYKNSWHLPGGRVMYKETIAKAIKRIAKAELNIKVKPLKLLGFMEFLNEVQDGHPRHSVSLAILVKPLTKISGGNWQATEAAFFKKLPKGTLSIQGKFLTGNKII